MPGQDRRDAVELLGREHPHELVREGGGAEGQRVGQPLAPVKNVVDKTYEKIRKQGAKAFASTTDPAIAEEWLRGTERILDRFDCTSEKKVSYTASLFKQDALDW